MSVPSRSCWVAAPLVHPGPVRAAVVVARAVRVAQVAAVAVAVASALQAVAAKVGDRVLASAVVAAAVVVLLVVVAAPAAAPRVRAAAEPGAHTAPTA